jgi:CheY-like chemotaxis protein
LPRRNRAINLHGETGQFHAAGRTHVLTREPRRVGVAMNDRSANGAGMAKNGHHILVIDDDVDMHDVVRLILEPLGYRVTCCTTAPAGWAALERDRPSLLLLDVMLSTPTEGFEVAARVRRDEELGALPIVLISSMPQDSGNDGAGRHAANAFLEKPLSPRQLRDAIEGLLRHC